MADVSTHDLNRVFQQMQNLVIQVDKRVAAVGQQVSTVEVAQNETRSELGQLRTTFLDFVHQAERTANIQRAETKIGTLEDRLEHQFGHYKVVRRSATGLLQGFDVGLVSDEVANDVSQELMMQTPRYWLTPALVALARWAADDPVVCEQAVAEAFRRSPDRTSLLFALVLRRQGRQASAVRWLRHYLAAQDPAALGREFAVILEAISQGAFGAAGLDLVQETLARWQAQLLTDDTVLAAQVQRWRGEVDALRAPSSNQDYPRLAAVSPQWTALDAALGHARAHGALYQKYTAMLAEPVAPSDRIEDAVDDILDRLVKEYDVEELPLRRELAYQEAVMDQHGDLEAARRAVEVDQASLETKLDYLTIQTTSALNPSGIGVSRSTQRIAVAACHDWFAQAHAEFTRDYRATLPSDVQATFAGDHSAGATAFRLPAWTGSFTTPMPELEHSLATHWDRHMGPALAKLAFNMQKAIVVPAIVVVLVLLLGVAVSPVVGVVLALIVAGIWGFVIYGRAQTALKQQQQMRAMLTKAKQDSLTQLRGAGAELTDWTSAFREADGHEQQTRSLIVSLATAGHAGTPFERRSIDVTGYSTDLSGGLR